jgi:hypothetical protein
VRVALLDIVPGKAVPIAEMHFAKTRVGRGSLANIPRFGEQICGRSCAGEIARDDSARGRRSPLRGQSEHSLAAVWRQRKVAVSNAATRRALSETVAHEVEH